MRCMFAGVLLLAFGLLPISPVVAEEQFIEGGHYELLSVPQPTQTGSQVEVLELFYYGAPQCNQLQPYIEVLRRKLPSGAAFIRRPVAPSSRWAFEAQVFYTFEALGVTEELHPKYFHALHTEQRRLDSLDTVAEWVAEEGGPAAETFRSTFNSQAVRDRTEEAGTLGRRYGLSVVPEIVVDGKYKTSVSFAGSHEKLIELIIYLIEVSRRS